jgi:uncharacterized membrane protein
VNFKKLCKIACVFIFLMCLQGNALAATIHGTVYEWYSFKPLENSIVEINSTPEQSLVATNAEYSFNLTPGTYRINASYFEGDIVVYETEEDVTISDDGEYIHDLLLFPTYPEDLIDDEGFENVDLDFEDEDTQLQADSQKGDTQSEANSQNTVLIFALLALCILLLAGYFIRKEKRNPSEKSEGSPGETQNLNSPKPNSSEPDISYPENSTIKTKISGYTETFEAGSIEGGSMTNFEPEASHIAGEEMYETETPGQQEIKLPDDSKVSAGFLSDEESALLSSEVSESPESGLPDDLKEIMDLIRANGNRITQRELRKKSPYSESKVSLMLSDLEERGLIEKFKRGRGNIIRIPDGEVLRLAGPQERKE